MEIRPTTQQLKWQQMEFNGFIHFGINTFTGNEWGDGKEDPSLFNPVSIDAEQWVNVFKKAGMKMLILTVKHHDGFCLWPSKYTKHSIKNSPWKKGKGDVVKVVAEACYKGGIKFGFYLSPWDRHEKCYGESEAYNDYFKNQLAELLTNYGEITEVWLDGAFSDGLNGKRQEYDWKGYYEVIRRYQPDALIAICGPDVRWVGNEDGFANETQWSVQVSSPEFHCISGKVWWPSECDVSIRPGWFYHKEEDSRVKKTEELLDIYYRSVGRNTVLLLNVPPDTNGMIHEADAKILEGMGDILRKSFKQNVACSAVIGVGEERFNPGHQAYNVLNEDYEKSWHIDEYKDGLPIIFNFSEKAYFNLALVQEDITFGQRIEKYTVEAWDGEVWINIVDGTTVGYKRINTFDDVITDRIRLTIHKATNKPVISRFGLYKIKDRTDLALN